ncbi:protein EARLY RESPONSIVE TO DEHYDRATION 15-like isoform X2 [Typha latifolia]
MATMAVSSGAAGRSTLNPNAPLFIPAALQQVEDFSPAWWELVKTTTWFRDHWFHQHQEQENFDGDDDEDVANLLPDSFDLGITEELSVLEAELDAVAYVHSMEAEQEPFYGTSKIEKLTPGLVNDADAVVRSLSLKSPKNGGVKLQVEPAKYREKPLQCISPKCSPRRIIQQPR